MLYKWVAVLGNYVQEKESILFKGGTTQTTEVGKAPNIGNYICNQTFGGGTISAEVEFVSSVENEACEFILSYDSRNKAFVTAGIGTFALCTVRAFSGDRWINYAFTGDKNQLKIKHNYDLSVSVKGSNIIVNLDGVNVLSTTLPFVIPQGQPGLWCMGYNDIKIDQFKISPVPGKVFIVMQFTPPYNELYSDVIVPVCKELGLEVFRVDEASGPGLVVADIAREIIESRIIIADITPANPNVYYEVGYAHALNKPTILIAEKPTQLPFDVSPYRVLFYENTIGGKGKVEQGLRKHLISILSQSSIR
jgi:hypothetical protein